MHEPITHFLSRPSRAPSGKMPFVAFVRGPVVSTVRAVNNEATPSIAFAYLAGYIKARGYRFAIIDGLAEGLNRISPLANYPGYQIQGLPLADIVAAVPAEADVLAVTAMFSGEWPVVRDLIAALRERFPDRLIVAGGEHITALTEYSLKDCPAIDVCVRGEGEHKLYEVLEAWRSGASFDGVGGIGYLDASGAYRQNGELARIREIDAIPWPHWPEGYLEKFWTAGKSYGVQSERDMPIMASRGCPYQCTFCSNPQMWTTRYILRDPADLIAEIESYIERYRITSLQFYDLTAITKKRWTMEFCRGLIERGVRLRWSLPSGTRSEALDRDTLALLKETGCDYLVYAPESGSADTLQKIKKRISLDQITASIDAAKALGIALRTNLIIGFPHETRRHVFDTIRYGLKLAARGVDEVSINIFSPYPGTEIFEALRTAGEIELGDEYFLALTSLNSDYSRLNPITVNRRIHPRELALYRIGFMLMNYAISYLFYPRRIVRTIHYLCGGSRSSTVLEHRLKDMFRRTRATSA